MVVTVLKVVIVIHALRSLQQLWQIKKERKVTVEDKGSYGVIRGVRLEKGGWGPLFFSS